MLWAGQSSSLPYKSHRTFLDIHSEAASTAKRGVMLVIHQALTCVYFAALPLP